MSLTILYRGPLSSCNYDCHYCPFAKQVDSKFQLQQDQRALEKFVQWCEDSSIDNLNIFITPWGEALVRSWYWDAFKTLTNLRNVNKVAVQTNLSCKLDWLEQCDLNKVGLWCTYHPSQIQLDRFISKINQLDNLSVSYSVGMVGLKEDFSQIQQMRSLLQKGTYFWINAYKREENYYSENDLEFLTNIDPHFQTNNVRHPSFGQSCLTGESVISVEGDGNITRCHFIKQSIGNLYQDDLKTILKPSLCTNQTCGCHIGYIHMPHLNLYSIYENGLLERVI